MKKLTVLLLTVCLTVFSCAGKKQVKGTLDDWQDFSESQECTQFMDWLRSQAGHILSADGKQDQCPVKMPSFYGMNGMFITFIKQGVNRGCYGSFYHSSGRQEKVVLQYLKGALKDDPRSKPLSLNELDSTDIIVTVTSQPFAVDSPEDVDIWHFGLLVSGGEQDQIFVPAEIRTQERLRKLIKGNSSDLYYSAFRAVSIKSRIVDRDEKEVIIKYE